MRTDYGIGWRRAQLAAQGVGFEISGDALALSNGLNAVAMSLVTTPVKENCGNFWPMEIMSALSCVAVIFATERPSMGRILPTHVSTIQSIDAMISIDFVYRKGLPWRISNSRICAI